MIAPENAHGKSLILGIMTPGESAKPPAIDHEVVKGTIITPNFGQSPVTVAWDKASVASKARSGSSTGFLSPPAPRGSADRAKLSSAYGSIP